MITKERLDELINKCAFIFYIYNERSIGIIQLDKSYGISVEEYNAINKCKPVFYRKGNVEQDICDADRIFETKEQAEWCIKYHATRTEELNLPNWEDFACETFVSSEGWLYTLLKSKRNKIYLWLGPNMEKLIEEWEGTEENYIKACDLCLKLFKGNDEDE